MNYEKAYKAVLQTAKQWIKDGCTDKEKICLECVFPELREGEDERIRTRLIEYFQGFLKGYEDCYKDGGFVRWEGLDVKSIIAWLEKQKEQKPAEWSEKDDQLIGFIFDLLNSLVWRKEWAMDKKECLERLKSIRPQYHSHVTMTEAYKMGFEAGKASSWKPSEEQMYSLGTVVKGAGDISVGSVGYNLKKLYEQLKKLGVQEEPEYYQHFDPDC